MDLTKDPLPSLLKQIAIPSGMGMLLQTILHLTDNLFAGDISTLAQAALALSFPLFFILFTFSSGLGTGTAALVGRALGAGDGKVASHFAGQAILLAALIGIALMFLGPMLAPAAFISMGATDEEYLNLCLAYMDVIFYGAPFHLLMTTANSLLTAQGDSRGMRNALVIGAVANVFLNWWFIYGGFGVPPLGIAGLALATVAINVGILIYLLRRISRTPLFDGNLLDALKPNLAQLREILSQVLPPALNQASVGLGIYIINWFVGGFGPQAMAAYGVATRLEQLFLLPALGLAVATLPLTAQNDGAGQFTRALQTRTLALKWGAYISAIAFVVLIPGGYWLMALVTPDEVVRQEGALYLIFDGTIFFAYVLLYINISFLQGLKLPMFALWMGLYRQIVAPLFVFWLLTVVFDSDLWGIWLGIALVTASGAFISEFFVRRTIAARSTDSNIKNN